jgi:hypothetical protein
MKSISSPQAFLLVLIVKMIIGSYCFNIAQVTWPWEPSLRFSQDFRVGRSITADLKVLLITVKLHRSARAVPKAKVGYTTEAIALVILRTICGSVKQLHPQADARAPGPRICATKL